MAALLCPVFQDLVTMVEQLARFLGVSCDKAQLESLSEHCHQLVDQCCNAEALPVGCGMCPASLLRAPLPSVAALGLCTIYNSALLACAICFARARCSPASQCPQVAWCLSSQCQAHHCLGP